MIIQKFCRGRTNRRGSVQLLVLALMIPVFCFVSLALDIGWITMTRSQLQNAADSSSIAGATQLIELYADYQQSDELNRPKLVTSGRELADKWSKDLAFQNSAGGVSGLGLNSEDIEVGFLNDSGEFRGGTSDFPNTVRVKVRRDSIANSPLRLFFAPLFGQKDANLSAVSSATIYSGLVESFIPEGFGFEWYEEEGEGYECSLLPVALDVNIWENFVNGGEGESIMLSNGDSEGNRLRIYPSPATAPGNFGLLCIGPNTNQNKKYSDWILNGPSSDDIEYLGANGFFPVNEESPKAWQASPGMRTSLSKDFKAIIGQPRLLPLFQPQSETPYQAASGFGSKATYRIVGFAGVTITSVEGEGRNLVIAVQPTEVYDPTAVFDSSSLVPAGAEPKGRLKTFTYLMPRLNK